MNENVMSLLIGFHVVGSVVKTNLTKTGSRVYLM